MPKNPPSRLPQKRSFLWILSEFLAKKSETISSPRSEALFRQLLYSLCRLWLLNQLNWDTRSVLRGTDVIERALKFDQTCLAFVSEGRSWETKLLCGKSCTRSAHPPNICTSFIVQFPWNTLTEEQAWTPTSSDDCPLSPSAVAMVTYISDCCSSGFQVFSAVFFFTFIWYFCENCY